MSIDARTSHETRQVKREGERRSVRKVATPKTYNERHLEAAAWAGRGTRDDPFVAS